MHTLQDYLDREKIEADLIELTVPMTTAEAAAQQLDVPMGTIFKSLVLSDPAGDIVVVVLPGDKQIDFKAVEKATGAKKLKFAKPDVVLRETGYPAGGTPPLGYPKPVRTLVDESVLEYTEGYAGGGRAELLLRIRPQELIRATGAIVEKVSL